MDCPDLETLATLVGAPPAGAPPAGSPPTEESDRRRLEAHLDACDACTAAFTALEDLEEVLVEPGFWPAEPTGCLTGPELLAGLGAEGPRREEHLRSCPACQADLLAVADTVAAHERGSLPPPSFLLRERLRALAEVSPLTETRSDSRAHGVGRSSRSSRRQATPGRASSRRRAEVPGRSSSGATRRAGRSSRVSSRRRSGRLLRLPPLAAVPTQPTWAWGVLAAAAGVLVALALALSSTAPGPRGVQQARGPELDPLSPERGPLVSDVRGADRDPRSEGAPAAEGDPIEVAAADPLADPTLPLPADLGLPSSRGETAPDPVPAPPADPRPSAGTRERDAPPPAPPETSAPRERPLVVEADGGELQVAMERLRGGLAVRRGDGEWEALGARRGAAPVTLRPGDRLRTRRGGGAFLALEGDDYELCIDQDSEVVVLAAARGPVLGLERGRLLAEVTHLEGDQRFMVATHHGDYSVLGTVFAVEAGPAASQVTVAEGTVLAANEQGQGEVTAGLASLLRAGEAPSAPRPADPAALGWAQAWAPRRQLVFAARFDERRLAGFKGDLSDEGALGGRGHALLFGPLTDNRFWGLSAEAPKNRITAFRAAPETQVQFSVWSERPTTLLLQALNETQDRYFKQSYQVPAGRWVTIRVPLMDLQTYFDPGKNPVREGDMFVELGFFAAEPGERFRVLLDDVFVYHKQYR